MSIDVVSICSTFVPDAFAFLYVEIAEFKASTAWLTSSSVVTLFFASVAASIADSNASFTSCVTHFDVVTTSLPSTLIETPDLAALALATALSIDVVSICSTFVPKAFALLYVEIAKFKALTTLFTSCLVVTLFFAFVAASIAASNALLTSWFTQFDVLTTSLPSALITTPNLAALASAIALVIGNLSKIVLLLLLEE
ncbi:hypothetical protein CLBCK_46200 [Clostridium beijerinckii]|uniref:Uncharacterized protein n=1 Tax=Clostridium beijerinckii TaxID=1520 RepID=A0A1S8RNM2_CLOBE|nr:hypothetical protein CLBCK_46200 [Clostridium beijerinckii]